MIASSVGAGGKNDPSDVRVVQCALNIRRMQTGQPLIAVDGLSGPETTGAIRDYQVRNKLPIDGRIDAGGPTISTLRASIKDEALIFGASVAKLLFIREQLSRLPARPGTRMSFFAQTFHSQLGALEPFRDLSRGFDPTPPVAMGLRGGPIVFGFAGVDDAAAATLLFAFFVAAMIIIMINSPAFRKAVEVRAKELDRIVQQLGLSLNVKFEEAIAIIVSVADETIDAANKCRQSPTFNASPECAEALQQFKFIVERIRNQLRDSTFKLLLALFKKGSQSGAFDVREIRRQIEVALNRMRQNAVDLQVELQNMRDKCNCPEV